MFELVIENNDVEQIVYCAEDQRMVELRRQRHARSLAEGEASIREAKKRAKKKAKK
ncbi:hypothetical protein OAN24_06125 [Pseudodesulfovibrio sp.]|nr:hypothetical protein [Pseudodesulfovibrio sp.]